MTAFSDETGRDWLPLKYEDGPDFCTVTFATGAAFALTVHPERMKLMEAALPASPVAQEPVAYLRDVGQTASDGEHDECLVPASKGGPGAFAVYRDPPATPAGLGADEIARHGIYIASKTKHADRWRFLRDKVGEPIISTWIDEAGEGESSDLHDLWRRCLTEASSCQVLIAYREKDEVLKGGWVEIGAALSSGIPVYAVGLEEFTIAKYRGITHFPDMKSAIAASRTILALLSRGAGLDQQRPHEEKSTQNI